jgi:hypothetical protein
MFATAQTLKSPKASAKKSDKAEIEITNFGLTAALKYTIQTLETVYATMDTQVKSQMTDLFVKQGCAKQAKPESFKGFENLARKDANGKSVTLAASGSCEFRKRSTASALSDEEVAILEANEITYGTDTKVAETFVINPEYANDQEMLAKVEKALKGIKGLPQDFIMKQEGVSKRVVTDETVAQVFKKPVAVAEKLLPLISTLAIKPTVATDDINAVWPFVQPLLGIVTQEQVREFQAKKDSKRGSFKKAAA